MHVSLILGSAVALVGFGSARWSVRELLTQAGFGEIRFFPSLVGVEVEEESQAANLVILGRKKVDKNENGNKCISR